MYGCALGCGFKGSYDQVALHERVCTMQCGAGEVAEEGEVGGDGSLLRGAGRAGRAGGAGGTLQRLEGLAKRLEEEEEAKRLAEQQHRIVFSARKLPRYTHADGKLGQGGGHPGGNEDSLSPLSPLLPDLSSAAEEDDKAKEADEEGQDSVAVPPGEHPSTVAGVTDTEAGAITHASGTGAGGEACPIYVTSHRTSPMMLRPSEIAGDPLRLEAGRRQQQQHAVDDVEEHERSLEQQRALASVTTYPSPSRDSPAGARRQAEAVAAGGCHEAAAVGGGLEEVDAQRSAGDKHREQKQARAAQRRAAFLRAGAGGAARDGTAAGSAEHAAPEEGGGDAGWSGEESEEACGVQRVRGGRHEYPHQQQDRRQQEFVAQLRGGAHGNARHSLPEGGARDKVRNLKQAFEKDAAKEAAALRLLELERSHGPSASAAEAVHIPVSLYVCLICLSYMSAASATESPPRPQLSTSV